MLKKMYLIMAIIYSITGIFTIAINQPISSGICLLCLYVCLFEYHEFDLNDK